MIWSYLMASRVAAPRSKRLIVEALSDPNGEEVRLVRQNLVVAGIEEGGLVEGLREEVEEVVKSSSGTTIAIPSETVDAITDAVVERIDAYMRSKEAVAKKAFTQAFERDIEGMEKAREQLLAQAQAEYLAGNPQAQLLAALAEDHLTKSFRKENPQWAFAYDAIKAALMPYLVSSLGVAQPSGEREVVVSAPRESFKPGVR